MPVYNYTTIDDPLATHGTTAYAINSGRIIGTYADTTFSLQHGFLLSGGVYTTINDPGALITLAQGINDNGQIVGSFDGEHGFLLSFGVFTTLDHPLATGGTEASGINDAGEIVGHYFDAFGVHGFFSDLGTSYITLDDPSAPAGTDGPRIKGPRLVVGYYTGAGVNHGFLLNHNTFTYTTLDHPPRVHATVADRIHMFSP